MTAAPSATVAAPDRVRRVLPGLQTLTEFDTYHGDCFWLAYLAGMHCIDPVAYPLTLSKLDEITADAIAHGYADAALSGGVNVPNASRYLSDHGIKHTVVSYEDFARRGIDDFHAVVRANAGVKPIIPEWAEGGHFHGDETGVQYHYSMLGGVDSILRIVWNTAVYTGAYLFADGDDMRSGRTPTQPIPHSWPEILDARPIAYIILDEPLSPSPSPSPAVAGVPAGWHDNGAILTAPNGHMCDLGYRDYVLAHSWDPSNEPLEEERGVAQTEWHAQLGSGTKQLFLRSGLRWNPGREGRVLESDMGAEVFALEQRVETLQSRIHDLEGQLAAAKASQIDAARLRQLATDAQSVAQTFASFVAGLKQ